MAIGSGIASLDKTHRELLSIGEQLAYYAERLEAGTAGGALHHSAYAGQVLPWMATIAALLADASLCARLVAVYPYWTTLRLTSMRDSLIRIEAALAPHHAGRCVDGCWVMDTVQPLHLTRADSLELAAKIRAELT
ncbi:MAG: hypothetical protein ACP5GG_05375 [Conexivisphaera sp.]